MLEAAHQNVMYAFGDKRRRDGIPVHITSGVGEFIGAISQSRHGVISHEAATLQQTTRSQRTRTEQRSTAFVEAQDESHEPTD